MGGLLASLDLHRLDYNAEPSRVARGGGPSSMGGVSFCSRSPPSGIAAPSRSRAAPSRVARGGGTAGEGGGASGDDDVAIAPPPRPLCERSRLPSLFTLIPPLAPLPVCLSFHRGGPLAIGSLLGFVVNCGLKKGSEEAAFFIQDSGFQTDATGSFVATTTMKLSFFRRRHMTRVFLFGRPAPPLWRLVHGRVVRVVRGRDRAGDLPWGTQLINNSFIN